MAFPDSWMQELLSKNDLVAVVGEYTALTPRGGKLWACCPFHHEKTPSFAIDINKQLYYCFGCHKGGSVIQFVRDIENMSGNLDAIKFLAQRVGMELPNNEDSELLRKERAFRQRLCSATRDAARFYHDQLKLCVAAKEYLNKRGLTSAMIVKFGLGYSPDSWDALYTQLVEKGYSLDELVAAGLVRISQKNGKPFDFFRNRVMFPIISETGNVIGFGGRTMGLDEPKYLNTGETAVYRKAFHLYALNTCNKKQFSDLIIVEGYMDVIALHNVGIENVVASLGTSLTKQQAKLIKRRVSTVYISYDGDSAGQNATMRGLDILSEAGLIVKVVVIPNGDDPDDFVKKYGVDKYLSLKDNALTLNSYKIERMATRYNLEKTDDRQTFAQEACKLIGTLQPVEQERYYDTVSKKTGLSFDTLRAQGKLRTTETGNTFANYRHNKDNHAQITQNEREKHELMLLVCASMGKDVCQYVIENGLPLMENEGWMNFMCTIRDAYKNSDKVDLALIVSENDEKNNTALPAFLSEWEIDRPLVCARECVIGLSRMKLNDQIRELSASYDANQITKEEYLNAFSNLQIALAKLKR